MPSKIRLSAIITNFNHGEFLYESIEHLTHQTRKPDEIIIVDDASTDHSPEVIALLKSEIPDLVVILKKTNGGVVAAIRDGLAASSAEYFAALGADDPLGLPFFELACKLIESAPSMGLCCGEHQLEYPATPLQHAIQIGLSPRPRCFNATEIAAAYRARHQLSIPTAPCIWRRAAWEEAGGLLPSLRWLSDWFAALVVISRHGMGFVPGVMQTIRYNPKSYSRAGMSERADFKNLLSDVLITLEQPAYADVRNFFKIPAVLSRFGFKILRLLSDEERFFSHLTPGLIVGAVKAEALPFDWDIRHFNTLSPQQLAETTRKILSGYAQSLTDLAKEKYACGNRIHVRSFCEKALDANPATKSAADLLASCASPGQPST